METQQDRLASGMKRKGCNQKELAQMLGVSSATISRVLSGQQFLDFDLTIKACEYLDISLDWLAYGREPTSETAYYRNPERQRIEYLLSILEETDYHAVLVSMEETIEIRMRKQGKTALDEAKNPEQAAG
jgi:transcriptional regulator with XRE-family HTH domain